MRRPSRADDSDRTEPDHTVRDALFGGAVQLFQPARGYRVNVDTLLLAGFAAQCRPEGRRVVDLGSGVGALALSFAHFGAARHCDLVERDSRFAALAERNLASAKQGGLIHVTDLEVHGLPAALQGVSDVVLSNPPFFKEGGERTDASQRGARVGDLLPFMKAAAAAMGRRARAFFVYPARALPEFLSTAKECHLVAKRLRFVHAFGSSEARLALLELRLAKPGGLVIDAPWIEWATPGVRSPELAALVRGALPDPAQGTPSKRSSVIAAAARTLR